MTTYMNLQVIKLRKISQSQKDKILQDSTSMRCVFQGKSALDMLKISQGQFRAYHM